MDKNTESVDLENNTKEDVVQQYVAPPNSEGSAISDLLYVLGLKGKSSIRNQKAIDNFSLSPDQTDHQQEVALPTAFEPEYQDDTELLKGPLIPIARDEFDEIYVAPSPQKRLDPKKSMLFLFIIAISLLIYRSFPLLLEPSPPSIDVIGSYNGKNITVEELQAFIAVEGAKEREHMLCPAHGYDHSKCDLSEECEKHPVDSLAGYQQMVGRLATEQIIMEWAKNQGITNREEVQHGMKDLLNDAAVEQYISQLHEENITANSISKWEVQQYYSENLNSYQGKTLENVEDEIRQILMSQKDQEFFPELIEKLKKTAGLQVDFNVLKVTAPSDEEISAYYNANISQYQTQDAVSYKEILISAEKSKTATSVIRKIRSGESFESVATSLAQDANVQSKSTIKGSGNDTFESAVWKMRVGDISDPITNPDGTVSIIQLTDITKSSPKPLALVSQEIENQLMLVNTEKEYSARKNDALFSIHGRRYTLGEFYTEFKELSSNYQAQLSSYVAKKLLVEQMISRELLLEKSEDSSLDLSNDHQLEELKIQYLSQILHEEKVDFNLVEPTKEEILAFYENNKNELIPPPTVALNLIWIDQGTKGEKKEQALSKANEALSLIQDGTPFSKVAVKYSEDSSAVAGGQIDGALQEDNLAPIIAKAAFSLNIGDVSQVLDYSNGYYIIQVRERTEPVVPTFNEASDSIKNHLQDLAHDKLTSDLQEKMLKEANFIIYNKTLRKLLRSV